MQRAAVARARRRALVLVAVIAVSLLPAGASASTFDPSLIVFPVIGEVSFTDDFSQPRGDHLHGATDIMAAKMQPVVAAADGVVTWIGDTCCYLAIDHGGGWETWYIHLNNDTPGTDDGAGWGIADGITVGTAISQGQLIGWVGDSGNAEWTGSHLHFEIRQDDVPLNPYTYLLAAPRLSEPGALLPAGYAGQFKDDEGSVHEADIDALYSRGITRGCSIDEYCPDAPITRGEMAAFIRRTLGLGASDTDFFPDDDGHLFEEDINAITEAGVGFGCSGDAYCPDQPLLREEMAELLVRAFDFPAVPDDYFADDAESAFQSSINALKAVDVTKGCDPADPALFCPLRTLTRAEMASFFIRSLVLLRL